LSAATITSTLGTLKAFFRWLAGQPGYKSRIDASDAEYFNPPANQLRVATARREQRIPTVEQILHVLATMPAETYIEKRDRAVIAFTLLTGARDGATASFKLKHIDMVAGKVDQDSREVATKRAKTFPTYFFPVGDDTRAIVAEWVDFLRRQKLWGDDDQLFPATEVGIGETGRFGPVGLARRHWSNATAIRKIFKDAFTAAGLPRANPHSFRNTLVQVAYQLQLPPEEFKVWSQNLGHESILLSRATARSRPTGRRRLCGALQHRELREQSRKKSSPRLSLWRPGKTDDARTSLCQVLVCKESKQSYSIYTDAI